MLVVRHRTATFRVPLNHELYSRLILYIGNTIPASALKDKAFWILIRILGDSICSIFSNNHDIIDGNKTVFVKSNILTIYCRTGRNTIQNSNGNRNVHLIFCKLILNLIRTCDSEIICPICCCGGSRLSIYRHILGEFKMMGIDIIAELCRTRIKDSGTRLTSSDKHSQNIMIIRSRTICLAWNDISFRQIGAIGRNIRFLYRVVAGYKVCQFNIAITPDGSLLSVDSHLISRSVTYREYQRLCCAIRFFSFVNRAFHRNRIITIGTCTEIRIVLVIIQTNLLSDLQRSLRLLCIGKLHSLICSRRQFTFMVVCLDGI